MTGDCCVNRNSESDWLEAGPLVRTQSVASRVIAGETLIVPIRGKVGDLASIYSFNGTGSLIWRMLETPKTVEELVAGVVQEFDIDALRAAEDVKRFVQEIFAVGLVEVPNSVVGIETVSEHRRLAEAS